MQRNQQKGFSCRLPCVLWLLLLPLTTRPTAAAQGDEFVTLPPEYGQRVPDRLVFNSRELAACVTDGTARRCILQAPIALDAAEWRQSFPEGVAEVGGAVNPLALTSDGCAATGDCLRAGSRDAAPRQQTLDFGNIPNSFLVQPGARLTLGYLHLVNLAPKSSYVYGPSQPYRSVDRGTVTWPSIGLAPNATLGIYNSTLLFLLPSADDTCVTYTARLLYVYRQLWGTSRVRSNNITSNVLVGPIPITVPIVDANSNVSLGTATVIYQNLTMTCIPNTTSIAPAAGMAPGTLAAAIAAPLAAALLALALLLFFYMRRRRRARRQAFGLPVLHSKDAAPSGAALLTDLEDGVMTAHAHPQRGSDRAALVSVQQLQPLEQAASHGSGSARSTSHEVASAAAAAHLSRVSPAQASGAQHGQVAEQGWAGVSSARPASSLARGSKGATGGTSSMQDYSSTTTRLEVSVVDATSASTHPYPHSTGVGVFQQSSSFQGRSTDAGTNVGSSAAAAGGPAASKSVHGPYSGSFRRVSGSSAVGGSTAGAAGSGGPATSQHGRVRHSSSFRRDGADLGKAVGTLSAAAIGSGEPQASKRGSVRHSSSFGRSDAGHGNGCSSDGVAPVVGSVGPVSSAGLRRRSPDAVNTGAHTSGGTSQRIAQGNASAHSSREPACSSDGMYSSGGGRSSGGPMFGSGAISSGGTQGKPGNSGSTVDLSILSTTARAKRYGMGSKGTNRVTDRLDTLSALLKARSNAAVLRDLKRGPLLGRGSYGRVYKGRWKCTTVAVKVIEHRAGGNSSGQGKSAGQEEILATSANHPNVVNVYHVSTMSASQRSSMAVSWLQEGSSAGSKKSAPHVVEQRHSSSSSCDSSGSSEQDAPPDLLETYVIMEFCERGSLERAMRLGKFKRTGEELSELVGIYKALLDTASGLDYLHSIGVVHGDLKTANVLLKGSSHDARGVTYKITDFGLSRVLDLDASHISTGTYGTVAYMPRELLVEGRMTQATDIYSFGLMMWELFTSETVMDEGMSVGQMFYMIAYQGWRPDIPPDCPSDFAELMTACWHEDPEQRPSASQLLSRMQKLYAGVKQQYLAAKAAGHSSSKAGHAAGTASGSAGASRSPGSAFEASAARPAPAPPMQEGGASDTAAVTASSAATAPASAQSSGQQQRPLQQQQQQLVQQVWQHQEQQLREVLQESARNFRAKAAGRARRGSSMEGSTVDSLATATDGNIGPGVDSAATAGPSTGHAVPAAAAASSAGGPRSPFPQAQ